MIFMKKIVKILTQIPEKILDKMTEVGYNAYWIKFPMGFM